MKSGRAAAIIGLTFGGSPRLPPLACLVLLLVFPLGCAPTRVRFSPDEARAEFGRIGIATIDTRPTTAFDRPMTSRWKAAGRGALMGIAPLAFYPLGILLPVTVPAGAIYGASAARSPEEVEQAAGALEHAVAASNIQELLRQAVIRRLTEVERYPDVVAYKTSAVEVVAEFNTVIEVRVAEVSLKGRGVDPTLRLGLHADVRVVRVGSTERSRRVVAEIVAEGHGHTFLEWAADDTKLFREQVTRELQRLAEKIVDEVFSRPAKGTSGEGGSASK